MDILRFITAGNVDDGKSTLIGRLLYDTGNIKDDILKSVAEDDAVNLAHITDGLRSERAQGITIDVAYKYFTTANRKYIITDAPGHFQYTKNLVTGASGVDAMIVLIDACNGITEQTRRHSLVASFLKIKQVVVAVNKMDMMGYSEAVFEQIKKDYLRIAAQLKLDEVTFIPMSALKGDNVTKTSEQLKWYTGPLLMEWLENCEPVVVINEAMRFTVQYAADSGKGYAGRLLSGSISVGDKVTIYPGEWKASVEKIMHGYDEVQKTKAGENICLYVSGGQAARGSLFAGADDAPMYRGELEATVCWLDSERTLATGNAYRLRINGMEISCTITEVLYKTDVHTFEQYNGTDVAVNEFAKVRIKTKVKVAYDLFSTLAENGRGILIDEETNYTAGAFVIA